MFISSPPSQETAQNPPKKPRRCGRKSIERKKTTSAVQRCMPLPLAHSAFDRFHRFHFLVASGRRIKSFGVRAPLLILLFFVSRSPQTANVTLCWIRTCAEERTRDNSGAIKTAEENRAAPPKETRHTPRRRLTDENDNTEDASAHTHTPTHPHRSPLARIKTETRKPKHKTKGRKTKTKRKKSAHVRNRESSKSRLLDIQRLSSPRRQGDGRADKHHATNNEKRHHHPPNQNQNQIPRRDAI